MSEIIEQVYCPNCDYRLELETHPGSYAILDGHAVESCPMCLVGLVVVDGELAVGDGR